MKFKLNIPRPSKLLPRRITPRRPFLRTLVEEVTGKMPETGPRADSSSVETPARLSSRYHGVKATSNPNTAIARVDLNPYEYTSGRWLHRNKDQTEARYIEFDYDALCRKAVEQCPGSQRVAKCKKIEGGFNRVFLFTMDDEQTLIARLPFSVAGPPGLVTHSEVATIAYSRLYSHYPHISCFSHLDFDFVLVGTRAYFCSF